MCLKNEVVWERFPIRSVLFDICKQKKLFVVNVIFMKCAVFKFLFMFSTLGFFLLLLVYPWPAIFCSVFNLYIV